MPAPQLRQDKPLTLDVRGSLSNVPVPKGLVAEWFPGRQLPFHVGLRVFADGAPAAPRFRSRVAANCNIHAGLGQFKALASRGARIAAFRRCEGGGGAALGMLLAKRRGGGGAVAATGGGAEATAAAEAAEAAEGQQQEGLEGGVGGGQQEQREEEQSASTGKEAEDGGEEGKDEEEEAGGSQSAKPGALWESVRVGRAPACGRTRVGSRANSQHLCLQ